jgi:hypothetical protein
MSLLLITNKLSNLEVRLNAKNKKLLQNQCFSTEIAILNSKKHLI